MRHDDARVCLLGAEVEAKRAEVRRFAEEKVAPFAAKMDLEARLLPERVFRNPGS
ncbi:hypothetical protein [Amycolatopsis sp. A1MSW2902]|uniref:hypothetical protein n=1 Tax=Amycolatopsis sp. A1MSW2902 TaxID=687413 RepID=UPI00307EDAC8